MMGAAVVPVSISGYTLDTLGPGAISHYLYRHYSQETLTWLPLQDPSLTHIVLLHAAHYSVEGTGLLTYTSAPKNAILGPHRWEQCP